MGIINCHSGITLIERVSLIHNQQKQLFPSKTMIGVGEEMLAVAKELMNSDAGDERFAAITNQIQDVSPRCCWIRAEMHEGRVLPQKGADVLFFNLLFVELLADLAMFKDYSNPKAIVYILSKYARLFAANNNPDTACFYQWLYSTYLNESISDNHPYLPIARSGSIFILIHEWLHTQPKLISDTEKLLLSDTIGDFYRGLSKKEQEEVCCDYSALAMFSQYGYERSFHCSKTESVGIAILSLFVPGIRDFLESLVWSASGTGKISTRSLFETLNKRIKILSIAIKRSCNSNLFFGDCDFDMALAYAETVDKLLRECREFYADSIRSLDEIFNSLTDYEQKQYSFSIPNQEWSLFA